MSPGIFFSPFFMIPNREHSDWHPQCNPVQICAFSLQSSLVCNRNAPYSAMGQDILLHGETLLIVPATDSDHITLPSILHPEHQQQLLWPYASRRRHKVFVHRPLQGASGSQWPEKRCSASFILKWLTASEAPRKRGYRLLSHLS